MKILSIIIIVVLSITILLPIGCTKDKLVDNFMCDENERVTYDDVRSILNQTCAASTECHANGGIPPFYTNYEEMLPSLIPEKFEDRVIIKQDMPQEGWPELDSLQYATLRCWIEGGYLEE